ncbi:MAG: aminoacyl-tRNA hydrolase, partial [Planctomycetes bacterium]|nr:aminoacyl-tRNA hydrolase [Planctomycetota bacterium]
MRVILGIGNPGREYQDTRHNIGFAVIDALARRLDAGQPSRKWQAELSECRLGDERVLLVKPQTYVNLSGASAQAVLAFHKVTPQDLLVVVDDINLAVGTLRLRANGSAGGHNGLKDIEACIGQEYPRLRLGVGSPRPGADQVGHVLGTFAPDERADAEAMIVKAVDCCLAWLREGVVVACAFNGPLRPPPPKPKPIR